MSSIQTSYPQNANVPKGKAGQMEARMIRLFSILAVLALAFVALAVFIPADDNDAIPIYNNDKVIPVPKVIDASVEESVSQDPLWFYVADDATVKVSDQNKNFIFYVENGKILELNFKTEPKADKEVTIVTVAGDPQFEKAGQGSTSFDGKQEFESTKFEFAAVNGMSLCYEAAKTRYDVKYDGTKLSHTDSLGSGKAIISVDKEFKKNPTIAGKKEATSSAVYIANGQSLVVESSEPLQLISGLNYGMEITNEGSKYTYTYYPKGYDAGTISLDSSNSLTLKDGTVTVMTSAASIKAVSVTADSALFSAGAGGSLSMSNGFKSGSLTFEGLIDLGNSTFKVGSGTKVTIENRASFVQDTTMEVNGTLIVKTALIGHKSAGETDLTVIGERTGSLILENELLWADDPATDITIKLKKFDGVVDTSAISEVASVQGSIATVVVNVDQTYQIIGDTNVTQSFTINGIVTIDNGVTLTIEDGAILRQAGELSHIINNGTIIVKAGTNVDSGLFVEKGLFTNNGTIQFSAKSYSDRNKATFGVAETAIGLDNKGTINISRNDTISLSTKLNNSGTITFSGKVVSESTFDNGGKFVLNGAEIAYNLTPVMKGGSVQIQSVKVFADKELKMKTGKNSGITLSGSKNTTAFTIRNVTFSGSGSVDMQGDINFSINDGTDGTVKMSIEGSATVKGQFTTPKDIIIAFGNSASQTRASLSVSGILTINKDTLVDPIDKGSKLSMTVTGRVIDYNSVLSGCNYTAALYSTENSMIYTNLETAISEAYELGIMMVETGNTIIIKDLTIPAGMNVQGKSDNVKITIGSSTSHPVVTIGAAGALNVNEINLKNGTLFVENMYDINEESVTANVKKEVGDSVKYQSLNVALDEAESGDYIALMSYYVLKDSKMTIPEGVTVDATADGGKTFAVIGSNLTIDGTLIVSEFYFIAENNYDIAITVNGYLKDEGTNDIEGKWYTPIGVSYYESTLDPRGEEVTYFVITSLDNIQQAIDVADDSKVSVEGKVELGDIAVKGTEEEPAEVTFKEDINAGIISLENASAIALPGKTIDATFADGRGSIIITGAHADRKDVRIFSQGENGVSMSGPVTDGAEGSYTIQFIGTTGMENATIGWGNYDSKYPAIQFLGETTVTGKRNHMENTVVDEPTNNNAGIVTVTGSLIVDHASKLIIVSDVDVLGTMVGLEKDGSLSPGNVQVEGDIFLGITKDEVFSEDALLKHYNNPAGAHAYYGKGYEPAVASSAVLAGRVSIMEGGYITAVPGSSIGESIIEDLDSMEIDIGDIVWITIYGSGRYSMDGLTPIIEECAVTKIVDASGKDVAKYDRINSVVYDSADLDLSKEDVIRILLDFNIYSVMIKTDGSIKAVYIDGILTYTGELENKFYLKNVKAGAHTVSVEPVSGYTAENAYLYDKDGIILPGLKFTFDSDYCVEVEGYGETAIYNVAGTEVDPVPVPDPEQKTEWTITTILLCILVLIIAIMAVIIALRLNRS